MHTEEEKQYNPGRLAKGNPNNQALIATLLNHPFARIMGQGSGYRNINEFILNQIEEGKADELNRLFTL